MLNRVRNTRLMLLAVLGIGMLFTSNVKAQLDADGHIMDDQVLVLGPFNNGCGCQDNACIDQNFIAPSSICEAFAEIDEPVEYDVIEAASTGYQGPMDGDNNPIWRDFSDGAIDGNIDFNADGANTGGNDDVMSYAGFYVEVLNDPQLFNLCIGSDDGVQVWIDGNRIHSNNACRGSGFCQDRINGIELDVGTHFFVMAVYERGGGFNGRLSLRDGLTDAPITIADENVQILGQDPGGYEPPLCNFVNRDLDSPSNPDACPPETGGPATGALSYTLLEGENGDDALVITEIINGVAPDDVIADGAASKVGLFDGWIGNWLLLGPYTQPEGGGAAPGDAIIRGDYLTDGDITELDIEPVADMIVETDFELAMGTGLTPGYDVKLNADGLPTWYRHEDLDPNVGINFNTPDFYNADLNNNMVYGVTYIDVPAGGLTDVFMGIGSDDSIQVLIDGVEVWLINVPRGWGGAGQTQDVVSIGDLDEGMHKVMVKVFEGGGGHGFRFRFQDANGNGIGMRTCFDPDGNDCVDPAPNGTILTYETTKGALAADDINYTLDVEGANISVSGESTVGPVIGDGSVTVLPSGAGGLADIDFNNDGIIDFENAHTIGPRCPTLDALAADEIVVVDQDAETIQLVGSGADIWTGGDTFTFAYQTVEGDFSARVTIQSNDYAPGSRWGKHGIMARQDCSMRSAYSFTHENGLDPQDAMRMAHRATHGGNNNAEVPPPVAGFHAFSLRLDRVGDNFVHYVWDQDGVLGGTPCEWFEIGTTTWDSVPEEVQVGLAVTSHTTNCTFNQPTYKDWEIVYGGDTVSSPGCTPPVRNLICEDDGNGGLDVSWENDPVANTALDTIIQINGEEVGRVAGTDTSFTVASGDLPQGANVVCVISHDGDAPPESCTYSPAFDLGDAEIAFESDFEDLDEGACPEGWNCHGNNLIPGATADGVEFLGREGRLNITKDSVGGTAAAIVTEETFDLTSNSLEINVDCYFSQVAGGTIADGFAIGIIDGDIHDSNALGGAGGAMGFHGLNGFAVEIDLWDNGGEPSGENQGSGPHIALLSGTNPLVDHIQTMNEFNPDFVEGSLTGVVDGLGIGNEMSFRILYSNGNVEVYLTYEDLVSGVTFEDEQILGAFVGDVTGCDGAGVISNGRVIISGGTGGATVDADIDNLSVTTYEAGDIVVPGKKFRRGDTDGNGALEITDPINNLAFQFLGTFIPPCMDAADYDDNGKIEITDPIGNLSHQFLGTAPPAPPGKDTCGVDPTEDAVEGGDLGCENEAACAEA